MKIKIKNKDIEYFKNIINKNILNEKIKEEILKKIDYFNINGEIVLDNDSLYDKSKNEKDFLEIKYINNTFLCNYTEWNFTKFVTISQTNLKNQNKKLERKEKIEYLSNESEKNSTEVIELEEIYNAHDKLAYVSKLTKDIITYTYGNNIRYYDRHSLTNNYSLDKKWYIYNGSIINYKLSKSFMSNNSKIEESYSICPSPHFDGYVTCYNYVDLDEELFKQFMSGEIIIDELLKLIDIEEYKKLLKKRIDNI